MSKPWHSFDERQRERMAELARLLSDTPIPERDDAFRLTVHELLAQLGELQLLIGAHNAANIEQIRIFLHDQLELYHDEARTDRAGIRQELHTLATHQHVVTQEAQHMRTVVVRQFYQCCWLLIGALAGLGFVVWGALAHVL